MYLIRMLIWKLILILCTYSSEIHCYFNDYVYNILRLKKGILWKNKFKRKRMIAIITLVLLLFLALLRKVEEFDDSLGYISFRSYIRWMKMILKMLYDCIMNGEYEEVYNTVFEDVIDNDLRKTL